MDRNNKCEMKDCENQAEYLTTSETSYIELCEKHWYDKYKK